VPPGLVFFEDLVSGNGGIIREKIMQGRRDLIAHGITEKELPRDAVAVPIGYLDATVKSAQRKARIPPGLVETKGQPDIALVPGGTPYVTVFGIPIAVGQFPTGTQVIYETVIVTAKVKGVADIAIVNMIFG